MKNKKFYIILIVAAIGSAFLSFTAKKESFQKVDDKAVFQKKWQYTLLLDSYNATYFRGPKDMEDLKRYLNYLKVTSRDPAIESLVLNDKMNIYYSKNKKYLYLYHFGLDGQDHHMVKYIFLSDSNKLIPDSVRVGKIKVKDADIVLGKITLSNICDNMYVFRMFRDGFPVPDSIQNRVVSKIEPKIVTLQEWLKNNLKLTWKMTLVKSRYRNNRWNSKLLCLQNESIEEDIITEKIDSIFLLTQINVVADSLYFPLFYGNKLGK